MTCNATYSWRHLRKYENLLDFDACASRLLVVMNRHGREVIQGSSVVFFSTCIMLIHTEQN